MQVLTINFDQVFACNVALICIYISTQKKKRRTLFMSPDLHQKKHLASPSSLSNLEASTHRVIDLHQLIVRLPPTISHSIAQKFSGLKDSLSKINMSTEK